MRRQIIYAGQIPLETDLLNTNRNFMVGLSGIAKALFGSSTIVNGLNCTPTSPASMQVAVGAGEIYSQANIDDTAYSSLSADTVHQIMKQGITLDAVNLSCPAPGTAGQSINYLIEAKFVESDLNPVTLPYYNASNPTSAYSGPANSGASQPTTRDGTISLVAKAGAAATTGSQTTPAADAGYTGLWVVTVAYGATSITSGNIAVLAGAPFVPTGGIVGSISATAYASRAEGIAGTATGKAVSPDVMAQSVQGGSFTYALAAGSANVLTVALVPAPAALTTGMPIRVKIATTNTAATTINVNGGGAVAVTSNGAALAGGELVAGQIYAFSYDGAAWELQSSMSLIASTYVAKTRTISGGGLVTGGGDLSANRTLTVTKGGAADIASGDDTKALTGLAVSTSVQSGALLYAAAAGTANALTAALAPVPATLTAGMFVVIKATATNTGAATLNLNSLGVKAITAGGAALQAGMLLTGQLYALIYDGTGWQLQAATQSGIVAYSMGTTGWELFAHGKLNQWGYQSGSITGETSAAVSFPVTFPNACFGISGWIVNSTLSTTGSTIIQEVSVTTTGATVYVQDQNSTFSDAAGGFKWRAEGY